MTGYQPFPVSFFERRRRKARGSCPMRATTTSRGRGSGPGRLASSTASAGIEKQPGTGNIDYRPEVHQEMTDTRVAKVLGVANSIPDQDDLPRPRRRRACGRRLGLDLRPDPPGGPPRARRKARTSPTSTSATSGRCRKICLSY